MTLFGSEEFLQPASQSITSFRSHIDPSTQISHLGHCRSLAALISSTSKLLHHFGISGFFLFELGCPANFLSTTGTLPAALIAGVKANGFHNCDLVLRHLMADPRRLPAPIFRSVVDGHVSSAQYEPPAFARHKEFVGYLQSFDIHDIYYFPFRKSASDTPAAFCLWKQGDPDVLHRAVEEIDNFLEPLAEEFYRVAMKKFHHQFSKAKRLVLSEVQRETLTYIAGKDLTATQVSALRGVHEVTVNKQVGSAKKALGVTTVPALIVEAIRSGLITVDGI